MPPLRTGLPVHDALLAGDRGEPGGDDRPLGVLGNHFNFLGTIIPKKQQNF